VVAAVNALRPFTVLAVDDEPEILASLRRQLRSEPYEVVVTESPFRALEMIEEGSVDLVIADIDMPGMNGVELVSRARGVRPDVVRILLTGDASLGSALDAINRGEVHRYLQKPWDKAELRQVLRQAQQRQHELRMAARAQEAAERRERLLSELEHDHPGIRHVEHREGSYMLSAERLDARVAAMIDGAAKGFLQVDSARRPAPDVDTDIVTRKR